ncbi:MAG: DUF1491 family protein [Caulobacteraceae bacterium]
MLIDSEVWVAALIRRVDLAGETAVVVRRGDPKAGAILVKTFDPAAGAFRLLSAVRVGEDESRWIEPWPGADETSLEAHIARRLKLDPDLWVVEITAKEADRFLTEPVERPSPDPPRGAGPERP